MENSKEKTTVTQTNDGNINSTVSKPKHYYYKRKGTTTITSYKTNFLTLMLYRSLVDKIHFVLGCNIDEIGNMSEICYRYHNKEKTSVVFIKTKSKNAVTDQDLDSANSNFYLMKCFQNFLLIKDRFNSENTDPLFKGNFDEVELYFVIHTPNSCKIKNRKSVPAEDKIFANNLHQIINAGELSKIFKVEHDMFVDDIINVRIEKIAKTIAGYLKTGNQNQQMNEDMLQLIVQFYNFLIPEVIQINELTGKGEFNQSLYTSSDKYYRKLKTVLYKELLKNSIVSKADSSHNVCLVMQRDIVPVIANGLTISENNDFVIYNLLTFDESKQKLVPKPGLVLEQNIVVQNLNQTKVTRTMMDKALEIAGIRTSKTIKIIFTSDIHEVIEKLKLTETQHTECYFENDRNLANQFLNSLYIYSEQDKGLVKTIKKKIEDQVLPQKSPIFKCQPELVYLQLHNAVQRWWLLEDKSYYLTNNNCDFLEQDAVIKSSYLSILNLRHLNEVGCSFKFKTTSLNLFENINDTQTSAIVHIISEDVLISSSKLVQYCKESDSNSLFVDFQHVIDLKEIEFEILIDELSKTDVDMFVLIMQKTKYIDMVRFNKIVDVFTKKIVIISTSTFSYPETTSSIHDFTSLSDIDNADNFLNYIITVQGVEDSLGHFIGDNIKLIGAKILSKIQNQEDIDIGKSLSDSAYEKLKDYFVERTVIDVTKPTNEKELCVFLDIEKPVVTIIAAPGMGKSKLSTHLSVNTKRKYPDIWIVRMNLLDYCEDFNYWLVNETEIGLKESMALVCKAEIGNHDFALELIDGVLVHNNDGLDGTVLLHLELIIASFNEGKIIFIFDGFDEICPHYEKVVVQFIKCFKDLNRNSDSHSDSNDSELKSGHRIWITCRPYNNIKQTLTENFATPHYLRHLNEDEQTLFYHKYWENHLNIEKLSKKQFANVEAFFEYVNQYRKSEEVFSKPPPSSVVPLRLMHEAAMDYLRNKVSSTKMVDKEELLKKWISKTEMRTISYFCFIYGKTHFIEGLEFAGTPLHMQVYADLFLSEILDTSASGTWEANVHSYEFYEQYLETKFKKIRLEEKCGEDVTSTDSLIFYDDEKETFIENHKWLALYSLFGSTIIDLSQQKTKSTEELIEKLKDGVEKSGMIDRIQNDGRPHFEHLVFAEYFAVECVADLLKTSEGDALKILIDFIYHTFLRLSLGVMAVFDQKLQKDEHFRKSLTERCVMKNIFDVMIKSRTKEFNPGYPYWYETGPKEETLVKLLVNESTNTVKLLLQSTEENLNSSNIDKFMHIFSKYFLAYAIKYKDIIENLLDVIRKINPSMIKEILYKCEIEDKIILEELRNEVVIKHLNDIFTVTYQGMSTPNLRYLVV